MKKNLFITYSLACLFGVFTSCIQDDKPAPDTLGDVTFRFNIADRINDQKTVNGGEAIFSDSCKSLSELTTLAENGKLKAHITLSTNPDPNSGTPILVELPIYSVTGGYFQTSAFPLTLGTYYIHQALITSDVPGDASYNPLFSGVASGSLFENYIPENERMSTKKVVLTDAEQYRKTPIDLWVLCASKISPESFGFIKWNIKYITAFCIPFMVNVCDERGDVSGKGSLKIEYKEADGTFTVLHNFLFDSNGNYNNICFKDDYSRPNDTEMMRITMGVGQHVYDTIISVANLLRYQESPSWDNKLNYMHINFCTCETWIFDCDHSEDPEPPTPPSECIDRLRFVEGGSPTGGSDNFLEFWLYKKNASGDPVGDGDNIINEIEDYAYYGVGNLADFEVVQQNGVFRLMKGLGCRSVNTVPYQVGKKMMQIILNVKAIDGSTFDPNTSYDLCKILIFNADGTLFGYFPYMGKIDSPNANNVTIEFDELEGLINATGGQHVTIDKTKCYGVGVWTYIDAKWEIDIKDFWVQTQGN
ncbi:MAG: hypothetical protein RR346_06725 [Bacteroidales bacterium]